ncbi:MAG: hypothetical protein P8K76_03090 [Candidatus Binatia bacterium]|nr:hypothetical protein [Candidatus Binatia bacterium]
MEALTEKDSGVGFHKPDDLGLWSPADFREDEHGNRARRNNNVDSVSFLVFDVDEGELCRKEILDVLSGLRASLMPSFNFSNATPKYRIVLDISRRISAEEFTRIMPLASTILEGQGIAPDPAALDAARLFYDSAIPDCNEHLWFADLTKGEPLDVDEILAIAPPAPPERVFEESSTPLFQSVLGILLSEAGMIRIDKGDRAEIICPFDDEHTTGQTGTALWPPQVGSDIGGISCPHTHCDGRTAFDYLSRFPQAAIDAARATLKATDL